MDMCKKGHPRTKESLLIDRTGVKICKICRKARKALARENEKKRDAILREELKKLTGD